MSVIETDRKWPQTDGEMLEVVSLLPRRSPEHTWTGAPSATWSVCRRNEFYLFRRVGPLTSRWTLARLNKNCQTLIEAPRVTHLADAGEESSSFHRVLLTGWTPVKRWKNVPHMVLSCIQLFLESDDNTRSKEKKRLFEQQSQTGLLFWLKQNCHVLRRHLSARPNDVLSELSKCPPSFWRMEETVNFKAARLKPFPTIKPFKMKKKKVYESCSLQEFPATDVLPLDGKYIDIGALILRRWCHLEPQRWSIGGAMITSATLALLSAELSGPSRCFSPPS